MRPHHNRLTLRLMMTVVAVISLNLAALRALIGSRRPDLAVGGWASLVVLEVGFYHVLADRDRSRVFWLGFIAGGLFAIIPILANIYIPQSPLTAPWLVEDRLVHVPLEDMRNAIFQCQSPEVHRITGSALVWSEIPTVVILISGATGSIALEIHRRTQGVDEQPSNSKTHEF